MLTCIIVYSFSKQAWEILFFGDRMSRIIIKQMARKVLNGSCLQKKRTGFS